MKLFIAGGTGVLGRRAVRCLLDAGHAVSAVSRSAASDRLLQSAGARPMRVDLFDADQVRRAVAGHDTVVNLATHIPAAKQAFRRSAWSENDRIRTLGSKCLADAALAGKKRRLGKLPNWLARLIGGELAGLLMRSQRISNRALRNASNWRPQSADSRTGWSRMLERMAQP